MILHTKTKDLIIIQIVNVISSVLFGIYGLNVFENGKYEISADDYNKLSIQIAVTIIASSSIITAMNHLGSKVL